MVQDERREVELYVREIGALQPEPIPGTSLGRAPFFSPDGRWLGFLADGSIRKVALSGGSPQKLCEVGRAVSFDASWAPDGETIVFATDDGLWRVSASGGSPEQLTQPDPERGEVGHHSPRVTSDGRGVFFTISITPETHLALLSLDTSPDTPSRNSHAKIVTSAIALCAIDAEHVRVCAQRARASETQQTQRPVYRRR